MTKKLDSTGLKSIADNYDLFYIDLWGVIHNGIKLHEEAINVLKEISKKNKNFVLLTNAPRPNDTVKNFLEKMGMDRDLRDHVFTSGEAALSYLKKNFISKKFYHIGPPRDFDLFYLFENNKSKNIKESEYLLCTGLFDDFDNDLNYYKDLFANHCNKKMICTNPDLIVDRGNTRELCAGSVAMVFEKMGGQVVYFGKPYKEIYKLILEDKKKPLIIGDNLRTDIKGANLLNQDSLFITDGVHKKEIQKANNISQILEKYGVKTNFLQNELSW